MIFLKNRKTLSALLSIIWIAQLLVEVLTFGIVWKLDMLPALYMTVLAIVFALVWALPGILMFRKKKKGKNGRRVVALLLIAAIVLGCAGISGMVSRLDRTVNSVTGNKEITTVMTVYVRAGDPAQDIHDVKDYAFAVMKEAGAEKTRKAILSLEEELTTTLDTTEYVTIVEMADALYAGTVDAVLTSSAYMGMLEDLDGYKDYEKKMRPLYEVTVGEYVTQIGGTNTGDAAAVTRPVVGGNAEGANNDGSAKASVVDTPFIIYLSGNDARSTNLIASRSDTNILAVVNPVTKQILLVNTPRDYYIPHPLAPNGEPDKLTHLGNDGIECSIAGLEELYNERVDFYAQINFTGFETLIDAIGGITVYFDRYFLARGETPIYEGENYLTGAMALQVARDRDSFADGDNARGRHQMKIIKAVVEKMMSGAILTRYEEILDSLEGMFVTDISKENVSKLVKMQLSDLASWNIQSYAVTGEGGTDYTYTAGYAYVMYPDQERVAFAKSLMDRVIAGDILTDTDVVYPG